MDDNTLVRVELTVEEMKYIMEAFDVFPTINSYGEDAVRIEDRINEELSIAIDEIENGDYSKVVNNDYSDELEDEVYPDEVEE